MPAIRMLPSTLAALRNTNDVLSPDEFKRSDITLLAAPPYPNAVASSTLPEGVVNATLIPELAPPLFATPERETSNAHISPAATGNLSPVIFTSAVVVPDKISIGLRVTYVELTFPLPVLAMVIAP